MASPLRKSLLFSLLAGSASAGCTVDEECELNGVCRDSVCVCDPEWNGETCGKMRLGKPAYAYGGPDSDITSWGAGPPVKQGNKWYLFVTEMAHNCGLSEWQHHSTVVRAVADRPAGPFVREKVVLPAQAHNPYYVFDPVTQKHLIFHIGGPGNAPLDVDCRDGRTVARHARDAEPVTSAPSEVPEKAAWMSSHGFGSGHAGGTKHGAKGHGHRKRPTQRLLGDGDGDGDAPDGEGGAAQPAQQAGGVGKNFTLGLWQASEGFDAGTEERGVGAARTGGGAASKLRMLRGQSSGVAALQPTEPSEQEAEFADSKDPNADPPSKWTVGPRVAVADALDGDFEQVQMGKASGPLLHFGGDNPAPYIFDNGTVLLLTRRYLGQDNSKIYLSRAESYRGPYQIVQPAGAFSPSEGNHEDPCIWRDARGHFHAFFHFGQTHAFSRDGLDWRWGSENAWDGGHLDGIPLYDAERPRVMMGGEGANRRPTLLFFASGGRGQPTQVGESSAKGFTVVRHILH